MLSGSFKVTRVISGARGLQGFTTTPRSCTPASLAHCRRRHLSWTEVGAGHTCRASCYPASPPRLGQCAPFSGRLLSPRPFPVSPICCPSVLRTALGSPAVTRRTVRAFLASTAGPCPGGSALRAGPRRWAAAGGQYAPREQLVWARRAWARASSQRAMESGLFPVVSRAFWLLKGPCVMTV